MKKIYLFLAVLVIFSCTNDKHQTNGRTDTVTVIRTDTIIKNNTITNTKTKIASSNSKQNLVGQWKEHWGIGVQTNVNTTDVYQILLSNDGNLSITTSNKKKYKIDQILFDGKELSFRKQNKLYPLGNFYVYYKLKLNHDFNWMEGPITNNKKQKDFVKWEKIGLNR
ncbi:MAG: hypothetical protein ACRYGB_13875 [Janthinobacterium lividum]